MNRKKDIARVLLSTILMLMGLFVEAQHYVPIDAEVTNSLTLNRLGGDTAYLVNEALLVTENGELNIESGVKIYFKQSAYIRVNGGRLNIEGSKNDSIYMLCYEFTHDWAGIQLKNISEEQPIHIQYIKAVGANPAISGSMSSGVTIKHCSFYNYYAGKGIDLNDCNNFLIDSCFFSQCVSGIELRSTTSDCHDNHFTNNIFDQGQINISVANVNYGRKCRDNYISGNCFQEAATAIYFESVGGVIYNEGKNYITDNYISSKLPDGNSNYASYGIKAAMDSLVIRNNVFWHNDEAITMLRNCHLIIEQNTFYENDAVITNLKPMSGVRLNHNTISEVEDVIIEFVNDKTSANFNNFMYPKEDTKLFVNDCEDDIDLRQNYWDTQEPNKIESMLIDQHDDPNLGLIDYTDYLSTPDTVAPLSPPHCVKKQFIDGVWYISWDNNPEADLDHYILFYGDFNYYKFSHQSAPIYGNNCQMPSQSVENIAIMACERDYDEEAYADSKKSAYAFATYYPFAGHDDDLCAPEIGYYIKNANIPYTYNSFTWLTSGTGSFADPFSLRTSYLPSNEDFNRGEVTLTLRVVNGNEVRTDAFRLTLHKQLSVFAGHDEFYGLLDPITINDATAFNYDSIRWHSLGDGHFDDDLLLNPTYYLGQTDIEQRKISLILEGWSFCGHKSDTVTYDLYETFILEGRTWSGDTIHPHTHVVAAAVRNTNPFTHEFYRTVADENGHFVFTKLLPNTYVLYAFPDTLSNAVSGVYYLGDLQWNESNMILVDGNTYDIDINLPSIPKDFNIGDGSIEGLFELPSNTFNVLEFYCTSWLNEGYDSQYCDGGLSNIGIILMNSTKQHILGFTLTDAQGRFRFNHLPYGTYHIMADIPRFGRGSCESVTLTRQTPHIEDLHLYINNRGHVAMKNIGNHISINPLSIYPNPSEGRLTLCGLEVGACYAIRLINDLGVSIVQYNVEADLCGEVHLNVSQLTRGIYTLHLVTEDRSETIKFIKR